MSHVTLLDSAFWALHPVYVTGAFIHDVTIQAPADSPNTDGACQHTLKVESRALFHSFSIV